MTAKAATSSAKHAPATAKHAGTRKHTETAKQKAARHAASVKAAATRKANKAKVTAKGKPATHAKGSKPAGFAVGDLLPVCSFEALAMSLRLAGQFVHDDEVAALWELCGAPPLGASVPAALDAASLYGLAGFRPQWVNVERLGPVGGQDHPALPLAEDEAAALGHLDDLLAGYFHGLILHVDVPGPHAVLATADGWWSWGERHDPWPCRIEEAWAVSWS